MQLDRQSEVPGLGEKVGDLPGGEGDALAERIHCVGEPVAMHGGQNGPADEFDVVVGPAFILRWNGVGAEKGGADVHRPRLGDAPGRTQHFHFRVEIEPVAGLDLNNGGALADHGVDAGQRAGNQIVLRCLPRGAYRRQDTAAGAGDCFVAGAFQPHFELARAVAAMHQVGMTVDQCRGNNFARKVFFRKAPKLVRQLGAGAEPVYPLAGDGERAILHQPVGRAAVHSGKGGVCQQQVIAVHGFSGASFR